MAIILRDNTPNNTGKGAELTYLEMDTNLESFYYSSSIDGTDLSFFTTGSTSHVVDLSGIVSAGSSGAQGIQGIQGLTGTGAQGTQGTSGAGSGLTIGGSDTQVQFNDGGVLGGDDGLVWNKNYNALTITSTGDGTTGYTYPSLFLSNAETSPILNDVLGSMQSYNNASLGGSVNASVNFFADGTWSSGNYPTGVNIKTVYYNSELTRLSIGANGKATLGAYGIGGFQGTPAYNLAVDSSGNIIESAAGGYTRPGSATAVPLNCYKNFNSGDYSVTSTAGGTPSANGAMTIDDTDETNVAYIKIYKSTASGTNVATQLEAIAPSGSITVLKNDGAGPHEEHYRILSVTDNTTYMTYQVNWIAAESDNGGPFTTGIITDLIIESDELHQLSVGYNRLLVTNNTGVTRKIKFAAPSTVPPDSSIYVELYTAATGATVEVSYMVRGDIASTSYNKQYIVYTHENSATAAPLSLGTSDLAILKFATWRIGVGGSNEGLSLVSADQVI